jgi:hypothetical protein
MFCPFCDRLVWSLPKLIIAIVIATAILSLIFAFTYA